MIGSLIDAGIGAVGSIIGGISASRAAKKAKQRVENQQSENQDWYNRRYNEDTTQRADAQRVLTMTEEAIKNRNRAAAGAAAVMGSGDHVAAQAKEANNQALADATSRIAAMGDARKDNIEAQYRQRDSELEGQLANIEMNKAAAVSQATQGVASAAMAAGGAFDDYQDAKRLEKAFKAGDGNYFRS